VGLAPAAHALYTYFVCCMPSCQPFSLQIPPRCRGARMNDSSGGCDSKFAEAEQRIQKRIQKLEKLNFRKQLKSYLSDSSVSQSQA